MHCWRGSFRFFSLSLLARCSLPVPPFVFQFLQPLLDIERLLV
jgi:hypothetical protein